MFSIAHSILAGHGFGSPYSIETGPTAQQTPGFPYLVAALARLGGSMDFAAVALLAANVVFSTCTCLFVIALGNRLRPGRGHLFGWAWALFPLMGYSEVVYVWDTAFYTLMLTGLICLTLRFKDHPTPAKAVWLGALLGLSLLFDPAHVLAFGVILVTLCLSHVIRLREFAIAVGVVMIVVGPWIIRNFVTFKHPVFIRSNVGYEVYRGLVTDPQDEDEVSAISLGRSSTELAQYQALGEYRYMALQNERTRDLIMHSPVRALHQAIKRFVVYWTGNSEVAWIKWPVGMLLKHILFTFAPAAALWGFVLLWRTHTDRVAVAVMAVMLVVFPLPYYLALTVPRYRAPIEPLLVLLGVHGLLQLRSGAVEPTAPEPERGQPH